MTETEMKLHDAATQMRLALDNIKDEGIVRSCVNAYISLARSVTFVMQRESSDYPELKSWYEEQMLIMKNMPLLRFFNANRVYSIHRGVVAPLKHVAPISDFKINGVQQPGEATMTFLQFEGTEEYFPGGSGGVFRLCEQYFVVLKELVRNWLSKRTELNIV